MTSDDQTTTEESRPEPGNDLGPLQSVRPIVARLGDLDGNTFVLLGLETWFSWTDLRFARIAVADARALHRRIPVTEAWMVRDDLGTAYEVVDVVGRGDRSFSNGEVRLRPPVPDEASTLTVAVIPTPGADALAVTVDLPAGRVADD